MCRFLDFVEGFWCWVGLASGPFLLQVFYAMNGVTDRLKSVKVSMLRTGNSPELTCLS